MRVFRQPRRSDARSAHICQGPQAEAAEDGHQLVRDPTSRGVSWNGKLWRLYAGAAASRATSYYEIDLEEALSSPDPNEAFRYFWLLFRAEAFRPRPATVEGEPRELSFLDRLLRESAEYARRLGDRLKERVFLEVFPELARGFIAHIRHVEGAVELSAERLDEVFRGTLTLLYRLLFLLYAESRDLLPAREVRGYREKSLGQLRREVAEAGGPIEDEAPKRLERARRRQFTVGYKLRILSAADAARTTGESGGLLRREGLYWSHLAAWRRQREEGILHVLSPKETRTRRTSSLKPIGSPRRRR